MIDMHFVRVYIFINFCKVMKGKYYKSVKLPNTAFQGGTTLK